MSTALTFSFLLSPPNSVGDVVRDVDRFDLARHFPLRREDRLHYLDLEQQRSQLENSHRMFGEYRLPADSGYSRSRLRRITSTRVLLQVGTGINLSIISSINYFINRSNKQSWIFSFSSLSLLLLEVIYREETLTNVMYAVTKNIRSIGFTTLLAFIFIYLFAFGGYLLFQNDFTMEVSKSICTAIWA